MHLIITRSSGNYGWFTELKLIDPAYFKAPYLFRSRKIFRLLMQSCRFFCFFFSRPFNENFKFLKTCPTIFIKFSTVIIHPKGPLRAQWYQNRITGMCETSPKLAQNWPKNSHFRLFSIFAKTPYDSNEIFYSHSTPYYCPLCAISSNSYDWDSSESEGKDLSRLLYRICVSGFNF